MGPQGPVGATGATGATGPAGPSGAGDGHADTLFAFDRNSSTEVSARGYGSVGSMTLPTGRWLVTATVSLRNSANNFAQDNTRSGVCTLGDTVSFFGLDGLKNTQITLTAPFSGPGTASLMCQVNNTSATTSSLFAEQVQLSAVKSN